MVDVAVADISANPDNLEPIEMVDRLAGSLDGIPDGLIDSLTGGSDEFGEGVGPLSHDGVLPGPVPGCPTSGSGRALCGIVSYRGSMAKRDQAEVFTITDAQRGLSQEQSGRTKRYLISMLIRTACVIAAIFVPGWPRWVFIVGAVALPYLAVVAANAGRENDEPGETTAAPEVYRPALPAPGLELSESPTVIRVEPMASGRSQEYT